MKMRLGRLAAIMWIAYAGMAFIFVIGIEHRPADYEPAQNSMRIAKPFVSAALLAAGACCAIVMLAAAAMLYFRVWRELYRTRGWGLFLLTLLFNLIGLTIAAIVLDNDAKRLPSQQ